MNGNTAGVMPDCSKSSRKEAISIYGCNKRNAPMISTIIDAPNRKASRTLFRCAFWNRRNGNLVARKSIKGIARNSRIFATVLTPYDTPTLCSIHNKRKMLSIGKTIPNHFCIQSPRAIFSIISSKLDEINGPMFPLQIISKK